MIYGFVRRSGAQGASNFEVSGSGLCFGRPLGAPQCQCYIINNPSGVLFTEFMNKKIPPERRRATANQQRMSIDGLIKHSPSCVDGKYLNLKKKTLSSREKLPLQS